MNEWVQSIRINNKCDGQKTNTQYVGLKKKYGDRQT